MGALLCGFKYKSPSWDNRSPSDWSDVMPADDLVKDLLSDKKSEIVEVMGRKEGVRDGGIYKDGPRPGLKDLTALRYKWKPSIHNPLEDQQGKKESSAEGDTFHIYCNLAGDGPDWKEEIRFIPCNEYENEIQIVVKGKGDVILFRGYTLT
eukprot:gene25250-11054_t